MSLQGMHITTFIFSFLVYCVHKINTFTKAKNFFLHIFYSLQKTVLFLTVEPQMHASLKKQCNWAVVDTAEVCTLMHTFYPIGVIKGVC